MKKNVFRIITCIFVGLMSFTGPALAQEVPSEWTCEEDYYGDGMYCDCGCGVLDTDCADANASSCDDVFCDPGQIPVADNNALCAAAICGDGSTDGIETCDDGNAQAGDGCHSNCQIEADFICDTSASPTTCVAAVCGDNAVNGDVNENLTGGREECDDGNTTAGDGCDANCRKEVPAAWRYAGCSAAWYGDDDCDCGCGILSITSFDVFSRLSPALPGSVGFTDSRSTLAISRCPSAMP